MWFAAKEAVEKKAMERGRQEGRKQERERIGQEISKALEERSIALSGEEIGRILVGAPVTPAPSRPYRRRSRRSNNG